MKYRIFISSVQDEFAAERRGLTECRRRKGSLRRPMRMSRPPSRSPSKIEGVPRQRRGGMTGGFKPEHVVQLGFNMEAIDRQIKNEWDEPTIGLLLCREGNRTVVEYALGVTDKPMGVARYKLTPRPPKGLAEIKKAADNANNMRQLASCYESGRGVPQDLSKTREWRAKELGII